MNEANGRVLGIIRAAIGLAVLLEVATIGPRLWALTGPDVIRAPYFGEAGPIPATVASVVLAAWILGATAFAAGFVTPAATVLTVAALAAVMAIDAQLYSNHLYLMILIVGIVGVAGGGAALSLDALRRGETRTTPAWALTAVRLQVSAVYLFAGLSKINATFLSGTVLTSYLRASGPLAIPTEWRSFELMAGLSVLTILLELMLAVGLWLPRWRRSAFTLGLALHAGMVFWMTEPFQLAVFALVMFTGYLAFAAPQRASINVVWDDSCGFCAGWIRWFRRLDWLGALRFTPLSALPVPGLPVDAAAAAAAMHAVKNGSSRTGFRAVIRVLDALPISFLWSPLMDLPPIRVLGDRAYRAVARRRTCNLVDRRTSHVAP